MNVVASGSHFVVRHGKDERNRTFAVRYRIFTDDQISASQNAQDEKYELEILRTLARGPHLCIPVCYEPLAFIKGEVVSMTLFPLAYGNLQSYIMMSSYPLPVLPWLESAKTVFRQLMSALSFIHGAGILHRDLKASNILVYDEGVRISDFSCALREEDLMSDGEIFSGRLVGHATPEDILCCLYGKDANDYAMDNEGLFIPTKGDLYSLGLIMLQIVTTNNGPLSHNRIVDRMVANFENPAPELMERMKLCPDADVTDQPLWEACCEALGCRPARSSTSFQEFVSRNIRNDIICDEEDIEHICLLMRFEPENRQMPNLSRS